MLETQPQTALADPLAQLVGRLEAAEDFVSVVASLQAGHGATLDGVRGSASALAAAALVQHCPATLVVVCPHPGDIDDFSEEVRLFSAEPIEKFPAWETLPSEASPGDEVVGDRLRLLKLLAAPSPPRLIVTSIQSLLQPVSEPDQLRAQTRRLAGGE
ncbi:MAG TPA: transcription-repair coupling factor, partial [Pirellulales bacterium]|nr:transcription-repair coupling factor [Pirellulales bacterium]